MSTVSRAEATRGASIFHGHSSRRKHRRGDMSVRFDDVALGGNSKWETRRPKDQDGHAYVGLYNQAQTCYLNSLLQTLYMTPEFRNALYRCATLNGGSVYSVVVYALCLTKPEVHGSRHCSYKFTQRADSVTAASSIAYQLQRLFIALQTSERPAIHTKALTLSFGWCAADGESFVSFE